MSEKLLCDNAIILNSVSVTFLIKLRDLLLTICLWILYVQYVGESLSFPIDFAGWLLNGGDLVSQFPNAKITALIAVYGQSKDPMTGVCLDWLIGQTVLYFGWAFYNQLRFRHHQRRMPGDDVRPEDLARYYGFSIEAVKAWQQASTLIMHHAPDGRLTDVVIVSAETLPSLPLQVREAILRA